MSNARSDLNLSLDREREVIHDNWVLFLIQGIILATFGLLAIGAPFLATVVVVKLAGWLFLIGGIVALASLFTGRGVPGSFWSFLSAIVSILAGIYILYNPLLSIAAFTLVLAAFFFAQGITQIFASLSHRRVVRSWGWVLFSGIVDLILGGIIVSGWPATSTWVIGILVGVNLFMYGVALIMTALASKDVTPDAPSRYRA